MANQGNTMIAPTFANVGITGKFKLSDISITGYEESYYEDGEWTSGAKKNQLVLQTLTKGGVIDKQYYWLDYIDGEDSDPASDENDVYLGWYKVVGSKYVKLTDAELEAEQFEQGQGFWMKSTLKKVVKLVPAGAVGTADVAFKLETQGNTAVGNARPTQITLGELTISDYDASYYEDGEWTGGAKKNQLVAQTLTKGGVIDKQYYWLDYIDGEDSDPASDENDVYLGWYKVVGSKYVKLTDAELDAAVFNSGAGFWFKSTMKKTGMKFNVPAVELD